MSSITIIHKCIHQVLVPTAHCTVIIWGGDETKIDDIFSLFKEIEECDASRGGQ